MISVLPLVLFVVLFDVNHDDVLWVEVTARLLTVYMRIKLRLDCKRTNPPS
jgi:hypothetical protein